MSDNKEWEEALVLNKAMNLRQMIAGIPSKIFVFIISFCVAASVTLHWTTGILFGVPLAVWMYRESYRDADGVFLRLSCAKNIKSLSVSDVIYKQTISLED